ncbi:hypothetical protein B1691_16700 [Geobacillus sp. 47C-IIb]|nr:hypothetical protein B1691_16700 [Geobacillus sp. 47C-IIb]
MKSLKSLHVSRISSFSFFIAFTQMTVVPFWYRSIFRLILIAGHRSDWMLPFQLRYKWLTIMMFLKK